VARPVPALGAAGQGQTGQNLEDREGYRLQEGENRRASRQQAFQEVRASDFHRDVEGITANAVVGPGNK
jgi:hypothetical protein